MNANLTCAALAVLIATSIAQEEAPKPTGDPTEEEVYIPKDLEDAVLQLEKLVGVEDKEKIRKGESDAVDLHFGLGMTLRNSWGLWSDSRLADYFQEQGITHPDGMSGFILDAFCRNLRGEPCDLLTLLREAEAEWPTYRIPIVIDGHELDDGRAFAVLYLWRSYDDNKRVITEKLLWHPDTGKTFYVDRIGVRELSEEQVSDLGTQDDGWKFNNAERDLLEEMRTMSSSQRTIRLRKYVSRKLQEDPDLDTDPGEKFFGVYPFGHVPVEDAQGGKEESKADANQEAEQVEDANAGHAPE